jgi:hypothetical protein
MKRIITGIFISMLIGTVQSQCLKTTTDDFTGVVTQKTPSVNLGNVFKPSYYLTLIRIDSIPYLELQVSYSTAYAFNTGTDFMLKFPDTIFRLNSIDYACSLPTTIGNTTIWSSRMLFRIDNGLLSHLATWDLKKFRIYHSEGYLEDELPMQEAVEMRNITKCFNKG